jgi:hypothetical protein
MEGQLYFFGPTKIPRGYDWVGFKSRSLPDIEPQFLNK